VHRATVEVYERRGLEWARRRHPVRRDDARAFARAVPAGEPRIDLGCGAGRYSAELGSPLVGLDAAGAMLRSCRRRAPGTVLVHGDLEALPFGPGTLHGAWANMSYHHVPSVRLPMALADLHRVLAVGAPLDVQVIHGDYEGDALPDDDVGGRFFASWRPQALVEVLEGAGFAVEACQVHDDVVRVRARRMRTLADTVAPSMRLLVVGLNPSLYAADAGVGFARPGNRFWPAALAAGLVSRDRDARHALRVHGVGMTDLVKRATVGAAGISRDEYRRGLERIDHLVRWLTPDALCLVGLAGWRAAVDPGASPGVQARDVGGRPVYLMPSTSGANAHAGLAELTDHLRSASALARRAGRRDPAGIPAAAGTFQ
jgi:TDG/mug DNA glycosylase family protein